jgi:nicotinamidase-related amidase
VPEPEEAMNATLLVIDPQNDFCDIEGAALPVPGANADLLRVAALISRASGKLSSIVVTLDSHATVSIERTTFWKQADGTPAAPFTEITEQAVREGRYLPREPSRLAAVLAYLHALEAGGRYRLMVWPVHCVLGTWGHNIHPGLAKQIAAWEEQTQRSAQKVLKGLNPMTEQYSAVRAEVPLADDPLTDTNEILVSRARPDNGLLLVAGEASSHCVAATVTDLLEAMTPEERGRVIILRDCMSPVPGFEAAAEAFFTRVSAQGVRLTTAAETFS